MCSNRIVVNKIDEIVARIDDYIQSEVSRINHHYRNTKCNELKKTRKILCGIRLNLINNIIHVLKDDIIKIRELSVTSREPNIPVIFLFIAGAIAFLVSALIGGYILLIVTSVTLLALMALFAAFSIIEPIDLNNLANELENDLIFQELLQKENSKLLNNLVDLSINQDAWKELTAFLPVINKICDASTMDELDQAKQEFDAKRHWTYFGLFPLNENSGAYKVERAIQEIIKSKAGELPPAYSSFNNKYVPPPVYPKEYEVRSPK